MRARTLLLLALSLPVALGFQGSRGLYETTEGRYAESALEMVHSGDYLQPTLGHRPHWAKPPLTYWAIAAGLRVLGRNEWGVRLFNAVAFCLTVLVVAAIGRALWDPMVGYIAGLVYLSSPFPVTAAAVVSTDTLLTLWELLAVLAYVKAYRGSSSLARISQRVASRGRGKGRGRKARAGRAPQAYLTIRRGDRASATQRARPLPRPQQQAVEICGLGARWWVRAMWLCLGLGFFTKGIPAMLPLLPLLLFHLRAGRPFRLAPPLGVGAFGLVGLSWYGYEIAVHPGLFAYLIDQEVVARNLTATFHRNPEWYAPLTIYLSVLLLGQGAWLADGIRLLRREHLLRPRHLWRQLLAAGSKRSLLLLWLLLPLLVFSLSRSRLPLYVLPLYAPIALALAAAIGPAGRRRPQRIAVLSILVLLTLKGAAPFYPSDKDMRPLFESIERAAGPGAPVALFEESKLYGLQFYLDGRLQRLSTSGNEPWADASLEEAVERSAAAVRPAAIVTRKRHAAALQAALSAAGRSFERLPLLQRELFVLK